MYIDTRSVTRPIAALILLSYCDVSKQDPYLVPRAATWELVGKHVFVKPNVF